MTIESPDISCNAMDDLAGPLAPENVLRREPLSQHTTYRVGGPADVMCLPQTVSQLRHALAWAVNHGMPWMVLGNGSNVLFSDAGYRGMVIKIRGSRPAPGTLWYLNHDGHSLRVGAGVGLARVASYCASAGLTGMEWGAGIPGVLGGSIVGNAGAHGWEMGDLVVEVDLLNKDGVSESMPHGQVGFAYRHTELSTDYLITGATLAVKEDDPEDIRRRIQEYTEYRKRSQPSADQSAGCMFRNPAGDSAGRLIDLTGCKGLRKGGAMVSPLHGNFIVNSGGATAADTLALIETVRGKVGKATGIELALEVRLVEEL